MQLCDNFQIYSKWRGLAALELGGIMKWFVEIRLILLR